MGKKSSLAPVCSKFILEQKLHCSTEDAVSHDQDDEIKKEGRKLQLVNSSWMFTRALWIYFFFIHFSSYVP